MHVGRRAAEWASRELGSVLAAALSRAKLNEPNTPVFLVLALANNVVFAGSHTPAYQIRLLPPPFQMPCKQTSLEAARPPDHRLPLPRHRTTPAYAPRLAPCRCASLVCSGMASAMQFRLCTMEYARTWTQTLKTRILGRPVCALTYTCGG